MRSIFYILPCLLVIITAYWAYKENYQTQAAINRVEKLQAEIVGKERAISTLTAEWAYLNRPDRLRDLVELNFETLQLLPITGEHFGDIEQIGFPPQPRSAVTGVIDLNASNQEVSE